MSLNPGPAALGTANLSDPYVKDQRKRSLQELWDSHTGRLIDKWAHYLPIYERYFAKFRGTACRILEIGVAHGGSLQLWKAYFGPKAQIIGLDIDSRARDYQEDQIKIYWADQAKLAESVVLGLDLIDLDIVIDDGSHKLSDQQASLDALWPKLNPGGVYLIEDCHSHIFPKQPISCMSSAIYPWVIVFENDIQLKKAERIVTGSPSRPLNPDERAAYGAINAKYLHTDL